MTRPTPARVRLSVREAEVLRMIVLRSVYVDWPAPHDLDDPTLEIAWERATRQSVTRIWRSLRRRGLVARGRWALGEGVLTPAGRARLDAEADADAT